jgi:hypothetical protein
MKPLKLKCLLLSEDGQNWLVIRQFYATDLITNEFLDEQFQGMKLKKIDRMEEKHVGANSDQG